MDHYQQLAEIALAQCPPSFEEVKLSAELDDGYSEIDLRCLKGKDEVHVTGYSAPARPALGKTQAMHALSY